MVEWKVHPISNTPYLMEINPRFWGSLELSVRAGVNFPLLYTRAARGEKFDPVHNYRAGVICRWLLPGELLRYLSQDSTKRESLRIFIRGLPGLAEEWDLKDIRGFLSSILCPAVTLLNPKYWKYLTR
jgi:predicted ATP-grasp superfamily ATP-dependent carboligase